MICDVDQCETLFYEYGIWYLGLQLERNSDQVNILRDYKCNIVETVK